MPFFQIKIIIFISHYKKKKLKHFIQLYSKEIKWKSIFDSKQLCVCLYYLTQFRIENILYSGTMSLMNKKVVQLNIKTSGRELINYK